MKKAFIIFFTLMTIFSCKTEKNTSTPNTFSNFKNLPLNKTQQVVHDLSFIFDSLETHALNKKIVEYEKKSTNQIAILTVDSITPYKSIQKYATDVSNYWGVGRKEKNNGLLIVLCNPCREVSISMGYETEKIITDSIAKNLIEKTMIPSFKENNFFDGVNKTLDSIINKWH